VQFSTRKFWKALTTLGDEHSVQTYVRQGIIGEPWAATVQAIHAPAGHIDEINLIQIESAS